MGLSGHFLGTIFDGDLRRWVMIVASVTTRVSIEEFHRRKGIVGNATDLLLKNYASHPLSQRMVVPSTLCPDDEAMDHLVTPIHFDTLVFLSAVLWHIHKMRRFFLSKGKKCRFIWEWRCWWLSLSRTILCAVTGMLT